MNRELGPIRLIQDLLSKIQILENNERIFKQKNSFASLAETLILFFSVRELFFDFLDK
jgi:hypothetical protein